MLSKKKKKILTNILACVTGLLLCAVIYIKTVSCGDNKFFILNMSSDYAYTLHPVTLSIPEGEIHLRALTSIDHEDGILRHVFDNSLLIKNEDNIQQELTVWGNKLEAPLGRLGFYSNGNIREFSTRSRERQKFCFKGVMFEITALLYTHDFEPYPYMRVLNFSDIILGDGTKISPGPPASRTDPYYLEFPAGKNWTLHNRSPLYFIAEGPLWESPVHLTYIEFEENWGKVIDYDIAKE